MAYRDESNLEGHLKMPYYRKCPSCGFRDPVAWRGSAYDPDREFADWDEFVSAYPDVANRIKGKGTKFLVTSGEFVYWRANIKGQVQRILLSVYEANGNRVSITWKNQQPTVRSYKHREAV